jgi:hypothetical protein
MAAAGADKKLAALVIEVLDERTKGHIANVEEITEREKIPKKWH